MAHDAPQATGPSKLVIRNIGLLLSGALEKPILDADTIVAENGKITGIGRARDVNAEGATTIVDAHGTTVAPGLIDSHVHPVAGDWTPRQNQINWIDSYLHGGVTTMISAGEVHMPGRPRDVVGLKAMAIFAQRSFWTPIRSSPRTARSPASAAPGTSTPKAPPPSWTPTAPPSHPA